MTPDEARELIGQTRNWSFEAGLGANRRTVVCPVRCVYVTGTSLVNAAGLHGDLDKVWCEYRDESGNPRSVWFLPGSFRALPSPQTVERA